MQEDRAVDKYSPLTEKERACGGNPPNPPEDDSWELVVPVPADAPRAPGVHPTLGKPLARWRYYDAKGGFLFAVCRWNTADGGKISLPCPCGGMRAADSNGGGKAFPRHALFITSTNLRARPEAPVMVCEGESSANAAARIFPDYVAVTSPGGCKSAAKAAWTPLAGRTVTIWPDADEPGTKYETDVAGILQKIECQVSAIDAMALAAIAPGGGTREPEQGWDAADAEVEWDPAALRKAVEDCTKTFEFDPHFVSWGDFTMNEKGFI
jgi:putative DNA primase/helicase